MSDFTFNGRKFTTKNGWDFSKLIKDGNYRPAKPKIQTKLFDFDGGKNERKSKTRE